jgi:hypothetical protein
MADVTPFMKRANAYFLSQGYSPQAAAALAGHGQWESSGSSTIEDPRGEGSIGLYQWRLDRRTALNDFARARGIDPRSEDTQLRFADWELSNTERNAGDQLRSAGDLDSANAAVMNFLRPAGWTSQNPQAGHAWSNRLALSQAVLGDTPQTQPAQSFAQDSDVAGTVLPGTTSTPQADQQSPWNSLQRSGMRMLDLGTPEIADGGSAPVVQPQIHRGQPQPVSLLDLVFTSRKRPTMKG